MGCGGSKEDVATGNTVDASATATASGARKFFLRRKSSAAVSTGQLSSHESLTDASSIAVKDGKEAIAEAKDVATSLEKFIEEKEDDGAVVAAPLNKEEVVVVEQPKEVKDEVELPQSTNVDEVAVAVKLDKAKEVKLEEEKKVVKVEEVKAEEKENDKISQEPEKEKSPVLGNANGESVGQPATETEEAKPIGETAGGQESKLAAPEKNAEEQTAAASKSLAK